MSSLRGSLVKVRGDGKEYTYHVRGDLRDLDGSRDFSVYAGDLGIVLDPSLPTKKGWAAYIKVLFFDGKIGYISEMLVERIT
jgi:hypothetical protein